MKQSATRSGVVLTIAAASLLTAGVGIGVAASTAVVDTTSVHLRVVQSDFPAGFDSGWHMHPGIVVVQVQEGRFKIYQGDCEARVVKAGDTYLEVPFVPVRAISRSPIKWTTSQVLPAGEAPQTAVASPCEPGSDD
jgi:hypothetical protein